MKQLKRITELLFILTLFSLISPTELNGQVEEAEYVR